MNKSHASILNYNNEYGNEVVMNNHLYNEQNVFAILKTG